MQMLRTKLYDIKMREQQDAVSSARKSQVSPARALSRPRWGSVGL